MWVKKYVIVVFHLFQCFSNFASVNETSHIYHPCVAVQQQGIVGQGIGNQVQAHTFDDKMSGTRGCGCSTILRRPKMLYMVL